MYLTSALLVAHFIDNRFYRDILKSSRFNRGEEAYPAKEEVDCRTQAFYKT